jgi:hypothetical protein
MEAKTEGQIETMRQTESDTDKKKDGKKQTGKY